MTILGLWRAQKRLHAVGLMLLLYLKITPGYQFDDDGVMF